MKTLTRILAAIILALALAAPASAVTIKPDKQVGTMLRIIGGIKRQIAGQSAPDFFKRLGTDEKAGFDKIFTVVVERTGKAPSAVYVAKALSRLDGALKTSRYKMELKAFLGEIDYFAKECTKLGPDAETAAKRMMVGLMTNVKESGVHDLQAFTTVLGTSAEILEINRLFRAGVVKEVQPILKTKLFREAECLGEVDGIGMANKWFLEVKNWLKFAGTDAHNKLTTQIDNHIRKLRNEYHIQADKNVDDVPGIVYRFAAAGKDDVNFEAFKKHIEETFKKLLIDKHGGDNIDAAVKQKIDEYVAKRVKVELVVQPTQ